jgi:acyl-CoA synthetase (AMP-forming)/AMP-acid ligase II/thioesterase domain-containing protein/acyl carrier protein
MNYYLLNAPPLSASARHSLDSEVSDDRSLTLGEAISRVAKAFPDQPAIISTTSAPLTYAELQHQIEETSRRLRAAGLGSKARIGIVVPEAAQAALAIVAVACCAVAVPIDPRLTRSEFGQFLDALQLDALLIVRDGPAASYRAAEQHGIVLIEAVPKPGKLGLELRTPHADGPTPPEEADPDAPAFILRSSGTTARPKLIPFSHRNMLAAAAKWRSWFRLTPEDRCLCVSAPYYSHGLKVTIFTPLLTGGSIAFPLSPATVDLHEWFEALRPTWYSAGPAIHRAILDAARTRPHTVVNRALRFASSGGAPLQAEVQTNLGDLLGIPVLEHYGSSEAAQIAVNAPFPGEFKMGTVGRPWPGTLAIVGDDTLPLAAGERGEILVRGATVIQGYLGDPALNEAAFVDGWLRTGDLGSLDEDGFLTLHGRLRELINRGGEKVSPQEVDDALTRYPGIAEAATFPVPHPRLGEDVAAAVVPRPGVTVDTAALRDFLRSELAYFKIPRRIVVMDQLPKGMTGKVQRQRLSERFAWTGADEAAASNSAINSTTPPTLESKILEIWRRLLKTDTLTIDDDFFGKGGDSLLATEMLIEIEKLLGRYIPESILAEADTIRELVPKLVEASSHGSPVIDFHPNGAHRPLFWFHGDFLQGGYYIRRFAKLLGEQQPVTSIAPHGMNDEPIPASIEQMALDRLPLILERQSKGPYRIGGYCNGALVAFEAARLLVKAGNEVEVVAMVDPPTTNASLCWRMVLRLMGYALSEHHLARAYWLISKIDETSNWSLARRVNSVLVKLYQSEPVRFCREWRDRNGSLSEGSGAEISPVSQRYLNYSLVMARYLPARLAVPIVFFSADCNGRAWRRFGLTFKRIEVPGGHSRCIKDHTASITAHLRALLENTHPSGRS